MSSTRPYCMLWLPLVLACSPGADADGATSSGPGSSTGTSGLGGAGGADVGAPASGPSITVQSGAGGSDACLTDEAQGDRTPLDLVVLIDRSFSMDGPLWDGTVEALTAFFVGDGFDDTRVALNYFPPAGDGSECNPNGYNPPHVPMTPLASGASVLVDDLAAQVPAGINTPTYGALYGTLQYATGLADVVPDRKVIVVFASDGEPTACNTNIADIADIAATALAYNGVQTFVVAIDGADFDELNPIAVAGGSGAAIDITSDVTLLRDALDAIQREAVACEYAIPSPEGVVFDPRALNVRVTTSGGEATTVPQVADAEACGNGPGWYYDNPTAPTRVLFCEATCEALGADASARVDFAFGCPTEIR